MLSSSSVLSAQEISFMAKFMSCSASFGGVQDKLNNVLLEAYFFSITIVEIHRCFLFEP
jgi:hypothetical protein